MILLRVDGVSKYYGPEPVLADVTFDVRPGERIALVGPNGTGKTTLLKILARAEHEDSGDIQLHKSASVGYLEQQPEFDFRRTVWQEAQDALAPLVELTEEVERISHSLAIAGDDEQRRKLGQRLDALQHDAERRNAYQLDHRIERVLEGLGFTSGQFQQPIGQLSGGQQNRLMLARLLLQEPDLLLLDEPSNHLDLEATKWLEEFLAQSTQSLIVVSHDRYFLDRVSTRTLELFHGSIQSFAGNFTAYQKQKSQLLLVHHRTYEKQQTEIAKMEDFVRRNKYGQKHAQAADRLKKLERIERVDPPREITAPPMGFPAVSRAGDIVLRVERLAKGFDQPLFEGLTFDILRGERWGILGPNGSGKTTLLRCLMGQIESDEGRVVLGAGVTLAYFDQRLTCLDPETSAVDAIRMDHKDFREGPRRDLLARFGLTGDIVFQPVGQLSGGERNRVALAMLAATDANLLVLDEPTNHLDLWARDSLEKSLRDFEGTVLFVSHDRWFVNQVADHMIVTSSNPFNTIEGNYDTYCSLMEQRGAELGEAGNQDGGAKVASTTRETRPREKTQKRKRKFPYRQVTEIESDIQRCETRIDEIHNELTISATLRDGEKAKQLKAELVQQQDSLKTLYEHWEEAAELN